MCPSLKWYKKIRGEEQIASVRSLSGSMREEA